MVWCGRCSRRFGIWKLSWMFGCAAFLSTSVKLRCQNTIFSNDITERTNYPSGPIELIENAWELGWIQTVQYSEPFYHQYDMALLSRIPNLWINSPSSRWENVIDWKGTWVEIKRHGNKGLWAASNETSDKKQENHQELRMKLSGRPK